ncbi:O-antigen ligase family protein [Nodosilinea sp. LEGE 07088]|uniref:O-antigen ligase family protein n=1 Tax=Nodosilinea sp. LEGE 07088 TaxID=2777968 RepID=UPI00187E73E5|nr:O-antigen ligase family protein [Nodosilinea sp. LEGE 07088]MBE9139040.1 O-antigen ligase family protein [Nodosilinea sp. LEGE 07088]
MTQDTSPQNPSSVPSLGQWLGAIGLLTVIVMTWLPHSYLRMVSWPWALVWQLGFLAIGVGLIWLLRQFQFPFRPLGHGFDWAVAVTGAILVICSLASDFQVVALWNVILATYYFLALYAGANWLRQAAVQGTQVALPMVGTMLGTAIISLGLWRPGAGAEPDNAFSAALRNAMPFGHHNFVGGYFALALPLALAGVMAFSGWRRWLAAATTALTAIALYVSGSRGALLGILVWLVVAIVAFVFGSTGKNRPRRLLAGGLGVVLATGLLASNSRVRSLLGGIDLADPSGFVVSDGPLLDRYFMLKSALNIFSHRPLVGVGPGVMSRVSNLYRPIAAGLGLDHSQQLHNTPAQLLGELGVGGIGVYLLWLLLVVRLWLHLNRTVHKTSDRWLLHGTGGGLLAYGVSSLTDYQLENIGISMALVAMVLILLCLANSTEAPAPQPMGAAARRYLSLGLLGWLAITGYLWLMTDLGFWFGDRALYRAQQGDVAGSLQQLSAATAFAPWDPTYSALAGQDLYRLLPLVPADEQAAARRDTGINLYNAVKTAPNDAWFNYNLAAFLLPQDPAAAGAYARRAVQLLPRQKSFSRYLLGQTYLAQGQINEAAIAFSLEGIGQPEFLTLPLWQQGALAPLQAPVVDQALTYHQRVLEAASPADPTYATFYDQATLVRWWHRRPLLNSTPELLRPITQVLLASDQSTEAALAIANQALDQNPQDQAMLLLRAWLDPEQFAPAYLAQTDLAPADQQRLAASLTQYRDLRLWLTSQATSRPLTGRSLLGLTYRNRYAQGIDLIAPLDGLDQWIVPGLLGLFGDLPREFVALDQTVEAIQTEQLDLPSAANNHFEIVAPPPLPKNFFEGA